MLRLNTKWSLFAFMVAIVTIVSCKKVDVCEFCNEGNYRPVANAGKDTIIVSPTDRILLDGSTSNDPDGSITDYKWTAIPGYLYASVPDIENTITKKTEVGNLRRGIYRFELKVTDNKGAFSVDTVTVQVEDTVYPSHPVGFYPSFVYSGFSWNPTATGLMVVGPVPQQQVPDSPEDNDGSKWKVQLVQQATNTAIFLPYVKYNDIATTNLSIFYSLGDLVELFPGEIPFGSIYIFANPTQSSGIDLTKKVDVIFYTSH
jgi:hypothetical protein